MMTVWTNSADILYLRYDVRVLDIDRFMYRLSASDNPLKVIMIVQTIVAK